MSAPLVTARMAAQIAWRRENDRGKRHPCGCVTRFNEITWASVLVHACPEHGTEARR